MHRAALVFAVAVVACSSAPAEREDEPAPPQIKAAPVAPVLTASFEPASPDCNGWQATGARSIRSVPAHGGTYACKLCADGTGREISLSRDVAGLAAGRYVLRAWTRKRPQNPAPSAVTASLEADVEGRVVAAAASPTTTVRDDWDLHEATLDFTDDAASLRVTIRAPEAAAEQCILIDDVTVERAP